MGGLNDATRYREVVEGIEANNFTFGSLGLSTNYLQSATNYAQGWKVGLAGTNRNYKGAARATYSSGLMENGWAFTAQLAWRYTPYIDVKGQIGEGIAYNSFGYFLTAEKQWGKDKRLSLITFGAPTRRGQSAAVTQETYDLTNQYNKTSWGHNNYNPYWGYQDGKVRNSRIVETYDPTVIASFDWQIDEDNFLKAGVGYHYSMYSNSALTFYNAPDPRPDYYRNMPSFLFDGQIDKDGYYIEEDLNGKDMGQGGYYNGAYVGPSVNMDTYSTLVDLWTSRDDNATQINWDALYAANYANNTNNPAGSARYIVERRHNDIQEGMINLNYRNTAVDHLTTTVGLELKGSQGIHFKTVDDLLGGNQWIDVDPFAERDIKELATNIGLTQADIANVKQNDLRNPNAAITTDGLSADDVGFTAPSGKVFGGWNYFGSDGSSYYGYKFEEGDIITTDRTVYVKWVDRPETNIEWTITNHLSGIGFLIGEENALELNGEDGDVIVVTGGTDWSYSDGLFTFKLDGKTYHAMLDREDYADYNAEDPLYSVEAVSDGGRMNIELLNMVESNYSMSTKYVVEIVFYQDLPNMPGYLFNEGDSFTYLMDNQHYNEEYTLTVLGASEYDG